VVEVVMPGVGPTVDRVVVTTGPVFAVVGAPATGALGPGTGAGDTQVVVAGPLLDHVTGVTVGSPDVVDATNELLTVVTTGPDVTEVAGALTPLVVITVSVLVVVSLVMTSVEPVIVSVYVWFCVVTGKPLPALQ
jgi:hypothetical protein